MIFEVWLEGDYRGDVEATSESLARRRARAEGLVPRGSSSRTTLVPFDPAEQQLVTRTRGRRAS